MKKFSLIAVVFIAGVVYINSRQDQGYELFSQEGPLLTQSTVNQQSSTSSDSIIAEAFAGEQSNLQVSGDGVVVRILADDNDGSRHQRFILSLPTGQTLLVAHNIDLAPRISSLREGDTVQFYGEYEWNDQGGVIHWTHQDPAGVHVAGWLKHDGKTFQ